MRVVSLRPNKQPKVGRSRRARRRGCHVPHCTLFFSCALLFIPILQVSTEPATGAIDHGRAAQSAPERQHKQLPGDASATTIPASLNENRLAEGWLSLFDGNSLFGWRAESDVDWHVVDGTIRASKGTMSLLRTTTEFDDFELKVDFLATQQTNSGIFLRTSPNPKNPAADCYELNIADIKDHPFPTGSLVNRQAVQTDFRSDQWRTYHVVVNNQKIIVRLDGNKILEYEDPATLRRGFIGLQFNAGPIQFRNILIRPLDLQPMVKNNSLDQWDSSQTNDSEFAVAQSGELIVQGGPGQLESKARFANFVFSLQCFTKAPGLNSGVFFRSIPGDYSNGYESQIQNQFNDNDRTKPVDCGTGGIFRRANARTVNANDQEWFHKTIIGNGPHISVWVNGLQVTDWTDGRKPNANPRRGLRTEAGTIILQGHDPTTDILFRDMKIRELAQRR